MAATFLPLQVYGDYSRSSMAAFSTILSESWVRFELIQAFMVVLIA